MSQHHRKHKWNGTRVKQTRTHIASQLPLPCVECGKPVYPEDQWDVGHLQPLAAGGNPNAYGASHRKCNRSAGGKLGAKHTHRKRKQTREW